VCRSNIELRGLSWDYAARRYHQEVTGDDSVSPGDQELPPRRSGPPSGRVDPRGAQDPHTVEAAIACL